MLETSLYTEDYRAIEDIWSFCVDANDSDKYNRASSEFDAFSTTLPRNGGGAPIVVVNNLTSNIARSHSLELRRPYWISCDICHVWNCAKDSITAAFYVGSDRIDHIAPSENDPTDGYVEKKVCIQEFRHRQRWHATPMKGSGGEKLNRSPRKIPPGYIPSFFNFRKSPWVGWSQTRPPRNSRDPMFPH